MIKSGNMNSEGWYIIADSLKVDVIRVFNSMILHQQIERKDGRTYMRMKKRNSLIIK